MRIFHVLGVVALAMVGGLAGLLALAFAFVNYPASVEQEEHYRSSYEGQDAPAPDANASLDQGVPTTVAAASVIGGGLGVGLLGLGLLSLLRKRDGGA